MIKAEDTFLTSYVLFDRVPDVAEVEVVEQARALIRRSGWMTGHARSSPMA